MGNEGAEPKETKLDAANVETAGGGLVEDMKVVNGVGAQVEFFEHENVLAGTPYSINRYLKFYLASEEEGGTLR